jgi:hypothetical protein
MKGVNYNLLLRQKYDVSNIKNLFHKAMDQATVIGDT